MQRIDVINVFYVFYSGHVFYVFNVFYFKKTLSNAKYKYVKIHRKIFLEDDLAMIFIDFGLLRSLYCKISYLLKSTEVIQIREFDNLHMTVCKDNSWIHGKCRQRFFIQRLPTFFLFSPRFLRFLKVFFNFHLNVYYIYDAKHRGTWSITASQRLLSPVDSIWDLPVNTSLLSVLQVRENWKKSGNLSDQGKVREKYFLEKSGKMKNWSDVRFSD